MKFYFKLLRPHHWIKNLILFLPIILTTHFIISIYIKLIYGFISFSLLSSGGYIFNDIRDINDDRQHFKKKFRPLANGDVDITYSFLLALLLILLSFIISFRIGIVPFLLSIFYFILNYFYSIWGKTIRYIDILLLTLFYIIRIYYGSSISKVPLTGWFMATFIFAILSMSINKRYMECNNSKSFQIKGRGYNTDDKIFLRVIMFNFAIASLILLNIHSNLVLHIDSPDFYILINLSCVAIILYFFDDFIDNAEDPIEKFFNNKFLLFFVISFLSIYFYQLFLHKR